MSTSKYGYFWLFSLFSFGFSYNLLHVSSALGKEILHHVSKFGRVVNHDGACIPENPGLCVCQILSWGRPSTCMAHYPIGRGEFTANQGSNWPTSGLTLLQHSAGEV